MVATKVTPLVDAPGSRGGSFVACLEAMKVARFTGNLEVVAQQGLSWTFFFWRGCLVWQEGGLTSQEWWNRKLQNYSLAIERDYITGLLQREASLSYDILQRLVSPIIAPPTQKLQHVNAISRSQRLNLIQDRLVESIFDVLQYEWLQSATSSDAQQSLKLKQSKTAAPLALTAVDTRYVVNMALQRWQRWQQHGLSACLPSFFPVIRNPRAVQQVALSHEEIELFRLADGTRSFRHLSLATQQAELSVIKNFLPFLKTGDAKLSRYPVRTNHKPVQAPAQKQVKSPKFKGVASRKHRIACIDDSAALLKQLGSLLQQHHYDCLLLDKPVQAITNLNKWQPELILLDLVMPQINGYELCSILRRIPKFAETPIIILTGKNGLPVEVRSQFAGATEFLSKPINSSKLLDTIQGCLAGHSNRLHQTVY